MAPPNALYITASLPYVNGDPHLGHALEYVQADVLARHARRRGRAVRLHSGTDDHALKNASAALDTDVGVARYIDDQGARFAALGSALNISFDDYIHTSADARHAPAVRHIWQLLERGGDVYQRDYDGLYCQGCEGFVDAAELATDGTCGEHTVAPRRVVERNWFFRLERYGETLRDAITSGRLRIEPEHRRNEVLAFLAAGVRDISVSRDATRAHGWGISVPGDPTQIIYVWLDALVNYVSALGFGPTPSHGVDYQRWWADAHTERVHVVGKGIVRFHAVYWCAFLLSAGLALPDIIFVHDYLTVDGAKIGKSLGNGVDPFALVHAFGTDAVRWWLLREVPRVGDADFTIDGVVGASDRDLANGIGNLVQRVTKLASLVPHLPLDELVCARIANADDVADRVDRAVERFDFRAAVAVLLAVVADANRWLEHAAPWTISDTLERAAAIAPALHAARIVASELSPFLPDLAERAVERLAGPTPGEPLVGKLGLRVPSLR